MLVYATKFPVTSELTHSKFVELAVEWAKSSYHYKLEHLAWRGELTLQEHSPAADFCVSCEDPDCSAVHLVHREDGIFWINDYILRTGPGGGGTLAVQLYREASGDTGYIPERFKLPRLPRMILEGGYGGVDGVFRTTGRSELVDSRHVRTVAQLINGELDYQMPVVYVSLGWNGHYAVDPELLASELIGVAHVLRESDRDVSNCLRELTDGHNPYYGAVHIYYSPQADQRLLPIRRGEASNLQRDVVDMLLKRVRQLRIDDEFTWEYLERRRLQGHMERLKRENRDSLEAEREERQSVEERCRDLQRQVEDAMQTAEATIELYQQENEQLKQKIYDLNRTISSLDRSAQQAEGALLLCRGGERDLFPGEQRAMVLDALEQILEHMPPEILRRRHVLQSVLTANKLDEDVLGERRAAVSSALKNFKRMDPGTQRLLKEAGFELENGKNHYRLVYFGDDRYRDSLAKTASDTRGGMNSASDLIKRFL